MSPSTYRKALLCTLTVIYAFNYVDRLALGVASQNIKVDLSLSDTQLGVLSGIAFALFYSLMGLPIARWADRGNRVTIIALTTGLWSCMVGLCGVAQNFTQLMLIRIGVGVGEAGCMPTASSLIADYFSRAERPRAAAFYTLGGPLAFVVGYFAAGWLNEFYGWRMMFVGLAIPGIGLAVMSRFLLIEPRRAALAQGYVASSENRSVPPQEPLPSLRQVWAALRRSSTFKHVLIAISVSTFFSYGILQWQPAFFMRSYGLSSGQIGTWSAAIYGGGGLIGTYLGGEWSSRYAAGNERRQLRAGAVMYIVLAGAFAAVYLVHTAYLSFALLAIGVIGQFSTNGPVFALTQSLVPDRMRATAVALVNLSANLLGMGLGPFVAGLLSDLFHKWGAGAESLRYTLLLLSPGYLWSAWHFWRASSTVVMDLTPASSPSDRKYSASPSLRMES